MAKSFAGRAGEVVSSVREMTEEERIKLIMQGIRDAESMVREKYTWLKHQNVIGFVILMISLAGMVGCGFAYYYELMPAWAVIMLSAIFASLSHEIEHDLIHRLYFRKQPFMHNLMMFVVWIMRPNTVSPWYRRKIHILHHSLS